MKRYLKNLLSALMGNNPYEAERDELAAKLGKAGENVRSLQDQLYAALEQWESVKRLLTQDIELLAKRDSQIASLQQLVENLRERIADKDAAIKQYITEADALKGELQLAQGKELAF